MHAWWLPLALALGLSGCSKGTSPQPAPHLGRLTPELRAAMSSFCKQSGAAALEQRLAVPPTYLVPEVSARLRDVPMVALRCDSPQYDAEILFDAKTSEVYRLSIATGGVAEADALLSLLPKAGVDAQVVQDARLVLLDDRDEYLRRIRGVKGATVGSYGLTITRGDVALQVVPMEGNVDLSLVR